jgi:hypothetical protein
VEERALREAPTPQSIVYVLGLQEERLHFCKVSRTTAHELLLQGERRHHCKESQSEMAS